MGVYFQIKDLPVDNFIIDTVILTCNQYMEKRRFYTYTANSIMQEKRKKTYWESKTEFRNKEKHKKLSKNTTYRNQVQKDHNKALNIFVENLKEGGKNG